MLYAQYAEISKLTEKEQRYIWNLGIPKQTQMSKNYLIIQNIPLLLKYQLSFDET